MTLLKTALLVALLTSAAVGELPKCGAGYEKQTMDEDTFGYCTRIPSLKEEADRAEAFVHYGIPKFMYACELANHLRDKCMNKRDEDLAVLRVNDYREKIIMMGTHALLSMERHDEPDYARLMAAIKQMDEAAKGCSNK